MEAKQCVAGIGEILMDVFENAQVTLGGAPFNVSFHVHQLLTALSLGEAVFLSAIGSDPWGQSIRAAVASAKMTGDYIAIVNKPTGSALVFEHEGGAGFEIQQDVAWDQIHLNEGALALARRCDAVVFGSLAQRSDVSRASIQKFVAAVEGHRLYDVNLRRNTTDGVAGYSAEIIADSLRLATLVKMNDSELEEVTSLLGITVDLSAGEERMRALMSRLAERFSLQMVAITRGAKGAVFLSRGQFFQLPDSTLDQVLVHPVGAGDSFAAGLLFGVIQNWRPQESLELANLLSSYVVRHVTATPELTDVLLAQVRSLMVRATMAAAHSAHRGAAQTERREMRECDQIPN